MSDERWLSKEDRAHYPATYPLKLHAEAADERIAELAEALRQQIGLHYAGWTDPGNAMTNAKNALARVDALTKDTA